MTSVQWVVRPATKADEASIHSLVRSEKLNPTNLLWSNFLVAARGPEIIGVAQIRHHFDGSRELASVVVAGHYRGQGVAAALIRALLSREPSRIYAISGAGLVGMYGRFGFQRWFALATPPAVLLNLLIGRLAGLRSRLQGRQATPLTVLKRNGATKRQPHLDVGHA